MTILGIETSCDETSVALLHATQRGFDLKKHVVLSQMKTHSKYGGVVPEVAARMHSETLVPLLDKEFGRQTVRSVDMIAVTHGPGLITSLMVGTQVAKTLSYVHQKPLIGVNHLEGHIYATWLTEKTLFRNPRKYFPIVALIVSGGHTELVLMKGHGRYTLLGQTVDDAAGEAFDKVAKILGLGYPGGPIISQLAAKGDPGAIDFPRPMIASRDYNMSFSGLKTSVRYYLEKRKRISKTEFPDIAASFQRAVVDLLISKTRRAAKRAEPKSLILCGGVSANPELRESFAALGSTLEIPVFMPSLQFTGDNAAMIAAAAYFHAKEASKTSWRSLSFNPQLRLAV